ncbi:6075_t:CDS:2 [Ambispora leptoticha]|uniref:6075_t:CDS:1 n=1 Tax=Ambispora leptoticha TaxID=144679 RepID=A0A9N9CMS3_9GLOM|nr:6075_t:CDS:2 [Ambispora leptoticha]
MASPANAHYERNRTTWFLTDPRLREEFFSLPSLQPVIIEEDDNNKKEKNESKTKASRAKDLNAAPRKYKRRNTIKKDIPNSDKQQPQPPQVTILDNDVLKKKRASTSKISKTPNKAKKNSTTFISDLPDQPLDDSWTQSDDPGKTDDSDDKSRVTDFSVAAAITSINSNSSTATIHTRKKSKLKNASKTRTLVKQRKVSLNKKEVLKKLIQKMNDKKQLRNDRKEGDEEGKNFPENGSLVTDEKDKSSIKPLEETIISELLTEEPEEETSATNLDSLHENEEEQSQQQLRSSSRNKNERQKSRDKTNESEEHAAAEKTFTGKQKDVDQEDNEDENVAVPPRPVRRTRSQYSNKEASIYQRPKMEKLEKSSSNHAFVGREVVFVDPRDKTEKFWWPAMVVPHGEVDESMGFDELGPNEVIVKYFEDCTYSAVPLKEIKKFDIHTDPFLKYKQKYGAEFINHVGVQNAVQCIANGEPDKEFKWDYWMRPADTSNIPATNTNNHSISNNADAIDSGNLVTTRKSTRSRKGKERSDTYEVGSTKTKTEPKAISKSTRRKLPFVSSSTAAIATRKGGTSSTLVKEKVATYTGATPAGKHQKTSRRTASRKQSISSSRSADLGDIIEDAVMPDKHSTVDDIASKKKATTRRRLSTQIPESDDPVDIEGVSPIDIGSPSIDKSKTSKRTRDALSDYEQSDNESPVRKSSRKGKGYKSKGKKTAATNAAGSSTSPIFVEDTEIGSSKGVKDPTKKIKPVTRRARSPEISQDDLPEDSRRNIERFNFDGPPDEKEREYQEAQDHMKSLGNQYRELSKENEEMDKKIHKKKIDRRRARNAELTQNRKKAAKSDDDVHEDEEIHEREDEQTEYSNEQ